MKRVIIMGSPRSNGRSAHLAEMLFEANIDERPEDELFLVPVSEIEIGPCIGCGACRKETGVTFKNDDGEEATELRHRCIFDDDMQTLYDLLDEADELTIVSPVYFSGAPAPMKCVLDRMQPYFWVTQWGLTKEEARALPKRPATLHVVGEGGDPHGFDPLVSEVKSSLACAGFRLERVFDWVGKIDESGEITAEASEIDLTDKGASGQRGESAGARAGSSGADTANRTPDQAGVHCSHVEGRDSRASEPRSRVRPKLDLSSGTKTHQDTKRRKSGQKDSAQDGANRKGAGGRRSGQKGGGSQRKDKRRG